MTKVIPKMKDDANGELTAGFSSLESDRILLDDGEKFPKAFSGIAENGSDHGVLASAGIHEIGIVAGQWIFNVSTNENCVVTNIEDNVLYTTGAWNANDEWIVNPFIVTVHKQGAEKQKFLIKERTENILVIVSDYFSTSPNEYEPGDNVSLFITEDGYDSFVDTLAQNKKDIDSILTKNADIGGVKTFLLSPIVPRSSNPQNPINKEEALDLISSGANIQEFVTYGEELNPGDIVRMGAAINYAGEVSQSVSRIGYGNTYTTSTFKTLSTGGYGKIASNLHGIPNGFDQISGVTITGRTTLYATWGENVYAANVQVNIVDRSTQSIIASSDIIEISEMDNLYHNYNFNFGTPADISGMQAEDVLIQLQLLETTGSRSDFSFEVDSFIETGVGLFVRGATTPNQQNVGWRMQVDFKKDIIIENIGGEIDKVYKCTSAASGYVEHEGLSVMVPGLREALLSKIGVVTESGGIGSQKNIVCSGVLENVYNSMDIGNQFINENGGIEMGVLNNENMQFKIGNAISPNKLILQL